MKRIHIHIHRPTRDAGTAHDPSNGQFTSMTGGSAAHHEEQGKKHAVAAGKANSTAQYQQHAAASKNHNAAASYLRKAEGRAQMGHHGEATSHHELANMHALHAERAEQNISKMQATPLNQPRPNSSGVEVKHQPSGTTVPHQAPKTTGLLPPKSEPIPGGHKVTYGPEHVHALKDVVPQERARRLPPSGTTNLSHDEHEQMLKRHFQTPTKR